MSRKASDGMNLAVVCILIKMMMMMMMMMMNLLQEILCPRLTVTVDSVVGIGR